MAECGWPAIRATTINMSHITTVTRRRMIPERLAQAFRICTMRDMTAHLFSNFTVILWKKDITFMAASTVNISLTSISGVTMAEVMLAKTLKRARPERAAFSHSNMTVEQAPKTGLTPCRDW